MIYMVFVLSLLVVVIWFGLFLFDSNSFPVLLLSNFQFLSLTRNAEQQRRQERRSRSIKSSICTVGPFNGTDSGYITGDDQQKHEVSFRCCIVGFKNNQFN